MIYFYNIFIVSNKICIITSLYVDFLYFRLFYTELCFMKGKMKNKMIFFVTQKYLIKFFRYIRYSVAFRAILNCTSALVPKAYMKVKTWSLLSKH